MIPFVGDPVRIGIVTVSDRASSGTYKDESGPAIREVLGQALETNWYPVTRIIPDERALIAGTLVDLVDLEKCALIVTTGGTGPARRDVTPEATLDVCDKMLPGFGELMRSVSLSTVPTAILSRQTAGIRGTALIVNLPGRPAAIRQCLMAVLPAIPYGIDLAGGPRLDTRESVVRSFRPPQSAADTDPAIRHRA